MSKEFEAILRISGVVSNSVKQSIASVNDQLAKVDKKAMATTAKLAAIGTAAATAIVGAAAGIVGYSVKVGSDFEAAMSQVQAISGASGESLGRLTEKAKEMGRTTAFSASQAAEAMKYMAMAGWKEKDIIASIGGVMDLAAASGEELGTVSDIVTDAMTAFHMSAEQSGHFADVLAAASSNANTNVAMLGESFKQAAALAGTMGYSIEDVSLALGLMANAGVKGESAGVAIKNAIANMASPTKQMATVMQKLNLSLTDSQGNMKDFRTVIVEMRKSFKGLTKDQQSAAAATLFGKESMAGMLSVINASDDDFNKLASAIDNSNGSAKKMAGTMMNNLQGQFTLLKSVTESMGISIYEKFKGPLTEALKAVNDNFQELAASIEQGSLGSSLENLATVLGNALAAISSGLVTALPMVINFTSGFISAISTIAELISNNWSWLSPIIIGVGSAFLIFQGVTAIMSLSTVAVTAFGAAVAFLTSPIGIAMAAIAAIIAIGVALYQNWDTIVAYAAQFGESISNVWTSIKDGAANMAQSVVSFFTNAFNSLPDILKAPVNAVISLIDGAINSLNGIGFSVPDWVPGLGGKSFTVNIPNIPMLAKGGFTEGMSIAGEAGTEAVISFDPAYRKQNIGYLAKAAAMLGVEDDMSLNYYADKLADMGTSVLATAGTAITYNLGGIVFSPTVTVAGGDDKKQNIIEQLRNYQGDLLELIEDLLANKEAGSYGTGGVF